MTTYWTSTTTYPQAANGQVKAAKDLYGATSTQCTATRERLEGRRPSPRPRPAARPRRRRRWQPARQPGLRVRRHVLDADHRRDHQRRRRHPARRRRTTRGSTATARRTPTRSRQTVTIPAASAATLSFYLSSPVTRRPTSTAYDTLKVQVTPSGGATTTLATYSNLNKGTGYVARSVNLSAYTGKTVTREVPRRRGLLGGDQLPGRRHLAHHQLSRPPRTAPTRPGAGGPRVVPSAPARRCGRRGSARAGSGRVRRAPGERRAGRGRARSRWRSAIVEEARSSMMRGVRVPVDMLSASSLRCRRGCGLSDD